MHSSTAGQRKKQPLIGGRKGPRWAAVASIINARFLHIVFFPVIGKQLDQFPAPFCPLPRPSGDDVAKQRQQINDRSSSNRQPVGMQESDRAALAGYIEMHGPQQCFLLHRAQLFALV